MSDKTEKGKVDKSRYEGNGMSYKAKLIGIDDVPEARGDAMCQTSITKLKNIVKASGDHKQKILVNVTLEGLKILDATSSQTVLHTHPVHRISFISRDVTDNRAFGYIFGDDGGKHKLFAIKTAAAAQQLVLALRDLFQVVYAMKKQEMDEAKLKIDGNMENSSTSGPGSTSREAQDPSNQNADGDGIYQVPPNNAPVDPTSQEEQVANLLDLEDQAEHILKDIEQIKNLEFDSIVSDSSDLSPKSPTSPSSTGTAGVTDPWGAPASSSASPSSALAGLSLSGFNTAPFGGMPLQQQSFPGASAAPMAQNQAFVGMAGPRYSSGLPVTTDPFANDPFGAQHPQQQQVRLAAYPGGAGFGTVNPFSTVPVAGGFGGQPFPGAVRPPNMGMPTAMMVPPGMMSGMVPHGGMPISPPAGTANPFASMSSNEDANVLTPIRQEKEPEPNSTAPVEKASRNDLFGDLVDIKKSTSTAKTPKDMFVQINSAEKKTLNDLKSTIEASCFESDPFGNVDSISADTRGGLVDGNRRDPFDTSHIPALPVVTSAMPKLNSPHQSVASSSSTMTITTLIAPPPVPQRQSLHHSSRESQSNTNLNLNSSSSSSSVPSIKTPSISPLPVPDRPKELNSSPADPFSSSLELNNELTPVDKSIPSSIFMVPSPDEPPPPLPDNFIQSPIAPLPPPRPSSKLQPCSSSASSSPCLVRHSTADASLQNLTDRSSLESPQSYQSVDSRSESHNTPQSFDSVDKRKTMHSGLSQSDKCIANDPFSISLKTSCHGNAILNNNNNNNNKNDNLTTKSSIGAGPGDLKTDFADPFPSCTPEKRPPPSAAVFNNQALAQNVGSQQHKIEDKDPFGLPLHLTPGFKAVAKFGSDPFEDSFSSGFAVFPDPAKWDPFSTSSSSSGGAADNDPWYILNDGGSPFGDAFAATPTPAVTPTPAAAPVQPTLAVAPVQPVSGNTSGGSLLD